MPSVGQHGCSYRALAAVSLRVTQTLTERGFLIPSIFCTLRPGSWRPPAIFKLSAGASHKLCAATVLAPQRRASLVCLRCWSGIGGALCHASRLRFILLCAATASGD